MADELSAAAAFARRQSQLTAIPARDVLRVNLDIPSVVATVLGALPRIREARSELERRLPDFDLRAIDELEDYALALHHLHGECLASGRAVRFAPTLLVEARALRLRMLTCLKACAASGIVDTACWAEMRGTAGNKDLATDLTLFMSVFRGHPRLFEIQLLVTAAEIERGQQLTKEILAGVGRRELSPQTVRLLFDLRARAFTLLVGAYAEVRRAVRFLRLGGAAEIAPSLFDRPARVKRRRASEATEEQAAESANAQAPVQDVPVGADPWTADEPNTSPIKKTTGAVRFGETGRKKRSRRLVRGPFLGAAGFAVAPSAPSSADGAAHGLVLPETHQSIGEIKMTTNNDRTAIPTGTVVPATGSSTVSVPTATGPSSNTEATPSDSVSAEASPTEILARLQPEIQALTDDELIQVNIDVPTAVSIVLGSLPEIRSHRDAIAKKMNDFDLATFDKVEDYAIALNEAHGNYLAATRPGDDLDALLEEGVQLRARLLSDASALATRGLVDENKLLEVKGPIGHKNLASDLNLLAKVFQATWEQIQGKTAVTSAELERANKLNLRIIRVVGLREQNRAAVAAATDVRVRMFTLLMRAYDGVRRAISFLRWNERDSDRIAPSLFSNRTTASRKNTPPSTDTPPATPNTGGSSTNGPTAPNAGDTHAAGSGARDDDGAGSVSSDDQSLGADGAVGTPGSQPFINSKV